MPLYELYSNIVGSLFPGPEDRRERMRRKIAEESIGKPTPKTDDEPPDNTKKA